MFLYHKQNSFYDALGDKSMDFKNKQTNKTNNIDLT